METIVTISGEEYLELQQLRKDMDRIKSGKSIYWIHIYERFSPNYKVKSIASLSEDDLLIDIQEMSIELRDLQARVLDLNTDYFKRLDEINRLRAKIEQLENPEKKWWKIL